MMLPEKSEQVQTILSSKLAINAQEFFRGFEPDQIDIQDCCLKVLFFEHLLQVYWKGLSEPVRFFPATSYKYAHLLLLKEKTEYDALGNARKTWEGNDFNPGESNDLYFDLCFRETDPMDDEFERVSTEVYRPIFEHGREVK